MGLPWIRLDTGWPTNPKTLALIGEGTKGRSAAFVYIAALCYSGEHGMDGFIPHYALAVLQASKRDVQLLIDHRLWVEDGQGGWQINDWREYQQSNEETQRRSERAREAAQIRWSKKKASKAAGTAASNARSNAKRIAGRNAEENRTEENTYEESSQPSDQGSPKQTRATTEPLMVVGE